MVHLLAYLVVRRGDGTWDIRSYRDLKALTEDSKSALESDPNAAAIVHVGFWRLSPDLCESICSEHPGRVLLTGAAKFALPEGFTSASAPSETVNGIPIYLALSGFGYNIEDWNIRSEVGEARSEVSKEDPCERPMAPLDWLRNLAHESPELFSQCLDHSILSECLYQQNERLLPSGIRDSLGMYRFKALAGHAPSRDSIVDGLGFAPPWLLRAPLRALDLTVRARNCLLAENVEVVGDIARFGSDGLMRVPNLGRKSVSDIAGAVLQALARGCAHCEESTYANRNPALIPSSESTGSPNTPVLEAASHEDGSQLEGSAEWSSFGGAINAGLNLLSERDARVLRRRMGLGGAKQTLEQIGQEQDVTRERIRQIEKEAVSRFAWMSVWTERFGRGLERMLDGRKTPLPVVGLAVLDSWFVGVERLTGPLEFALKHFINPPEFELINISGMSYISRLRRDEWVEAEKASRALLASLARQARVVTESEARMLIESQIVGRGEELRSLLWETVTRWAHFSEGPEAENVLVGFGSGAESVVEAVLSESETPLHYSEIAKRCAQKGRSIELRRAHGAAKNVGYLLGRGVFGLAKHIDLSASEQAQVREEVEETLSETPGRQWHAEEIIDGLEARGLDFEGRLSKYDLNVILESSTTLAYLGRMVWTSGARGGFGTSDRLNIWQAVVALIERHGAPMYVSDIRDSIAKDRGIGAAFLIQQADPLIRVGENEWGVLWRDIPFGEKQANSIVEEIISVLETRGFGLHTSEVVSALRVNRDVVEGVNPIGLVSLAVRSERVKAGRGGYIYLAEWEGPRRLTVHEAVESAFKSFESGALAADVAKRASALLGREVANHIATSVLRKIATYDSVLALWVPLGDDGLSDLDESS